MGQGPNALTRDEEATIWPRGTLRCRNFCQANRIKMKTLSERKKEIRLLMEYAVPEEHLPAATRLLGQYEADPLALNLLLSFYSFLPAACDDGVAELRLLARKNGVFLIGATTFLTDYLYLVDYERAELLGPLAEGISAEELLEFFDFPDRRAFLDKHQKLTDHKIYLPASNDPELCHFCYTASGEYHVLGCPVEVCPWCGGQLTRCNCRFTILNSAQIDQESQIEFLEDKINEAGRIPFETSQNP